MRDLGNISTWRLDLALVDADGPRSTAGLGTITSTSRVAVDAGDALRHRVAAVALVVVFETGVGVIVDGAEGLAFGGGHTDGVSLGDAAESARSLIGVAAEIYEGDAQS